MGYRLSNQPLNRSRDVKRYRTPKAKRLFFVEGAKTEIRYLQALKKRYDNSENNIQVEIFDRLKHASGNSHQLYVIKAAKEYLTHCQDLGRKKRNLVHRAIDKLKNDNWSLEELQNLMIELEKKIDDTILNTKDELKSQLKSIKTAFEFDASLGDKICFILDRDHHSFQEEQFDDALAICEEENFNLGISTPNFEFFLLLHLTDDFSEHEPSDIFNNTSNFAEEKLKQLLIEQTNNSYYKSRYDADYFLNRFEDFTRNVQKFEVDNTNLKSEIGSSLDLILADIIE